MSTAQQPTALNTVKQPSPLSIRLDREPDLEALLEALAKKIGKSKHKIARAALRLGAQLIQENEERFYEALVAAEKAEAAAVKETAEEETKKTSKSKK